MLELANRLGLTFAPADVEGLESARPKDLEQVELCMNGQGLYFPTIDADVFVPGLVEGVFGSQRWMAARLGQAGGKSKSEAKARASRENGKRGGRPRKKAEENGSFRSRKRASDRIGELRKKYSAIEKAIDDEKRMADLVEAERQAPDVRKSDRGTLSGRKSNR